MARPTKRPTSSFHQFRQRIPGDVLKNARGVPLSVPVGDGLASITVSASAEMVQFSLRTRDPREAKARQGIAAAYLERVWQGLRDGPARLSHKDAIALAGEVYTMWTDALEDDPLTPRAWEDVRKANAAARNGGFGRALLLIGEDDDRRSAAIRGYA